MTKPAITATKTETPTPAITVYSDLTFSDGATIHVNGGLVCSQHGRRHCTHHRLAHNAIVTLAASSEAATGCTWSVTLQTWIPKAPIPLFDAEFDAWLEKVDAASPLPLPDDDPDPAPPFGEQVESLLCDLEPCIQRLARHLAATYYYLSPRIEAEDLAAEARLEVLETLQRCQRNGKVIEHPIPYFHRVARNTMADFCNRYGSLIRTPLIHLGHGRFHPWMRVESMQAMEEHAAALRGC